MSALNPVMPAAEIEQPWDEPWPASALERVPACPVCESPVREVLHEQLVDNVFFVAPGQWTMHRCSQCQSAYLDPRPDEASIGRAYETYYTHGAESSGTEANQLRGLRLCRRMMANGYINYRFGTKLKPASALGAWVALLLPRIRQCLDAKLRYLPRQAKGKRLLDVGCGDGEFLENAKSAGWDVLGLEPDPKAAAAARKRGLEVRVGTIDMLEKETACFDAITLSHVIEHVHAPLEVMKRVHRLLKPGGIVYIETPNIESSGARVFGKNWRGLETPRHLVLFNVGSLQKLLDQAGFRLITLKRRADVKPWMYLSSLRMQQGRSPYEPEPRRLPLLSFLKTRFLNSNTSELEFITLTAVKRET